MAEELRPPCRFSLGLRELRNENVEIFPERSQIIEAVKVSEIFISRQKPVGRSKSLITERTAPLKMINTSITQHEKEQHYGHNQRTINE